MQEYRRLGHFRLFQIFLAAGKHDVGNLEAKDFIGFLEHFLGLGIVVVQIFSHSGKLRSLPGKNISCLHKAFLFLEAGRPRRAGGFLLKKQR